MNIYQLEMQFYLLILDVLEFALESYLRLREWCEKHDREIMIMILSACVLFVFYCFYVEEDQKELSRMRNKFQTYRGMDNVPVVEYLTYRLLLFISKAFRSIFPFV